jgi:glycosyltransferase involved in cell wall biosynthesis
VHAHSSFAGFYVRLFIHGRIKVYSPHCFSFDRLDISSVRRGFYYLVEQILHLFTSHYVVNWPIEAMQVSRFRPRKSIYFLASDATNFIEEKKAISSHDEQDPVFIAVGRIRPQKDPSFFAEIARKFNLISKGIFIWIGEGDESLKKELEIAGVKVIPWLEFSEITKYYDQATATIITSKWESGPLTLFESLNSHTPVILRATKSSRLYGIEVFESVADAVKECLRISNMEFVDTTVEFQRKKCQESLECILEKPHITAF